MSRHPYAFVAGVGVSVLLVLSGMAPANAAASVRPASVTDALRCANPAFFVHFKKQRAVIAVAVGLAESFCEARAKGHNGPTSGCPDGSVDRGLWQINSCYHSEVSKHCAFKPDCNARAAKQISDRGQDWTPWSTYNDGAYRQYLDVAQEAVDELWG